jgi:hypothetical protein
MNVFRLRCVDWTAKSSYIPRIQRVYGLERSQAAAGAWFLAYKGVGGVERFYGAARYVSAVIAKAVSDLAVHIS